MEFDEDWVRTRATLRAMDDDWARTSATLRLTDEHCEYTDARLRSTENWARTGATLWQANELDRSLQALLEVIDYLWVSSAVWMILGVTLVFALMILEIIPNRQGRVGCDVAPSGGTGAMGCNDLANDNASMNGGIESTTSDGEERLLRDSADEREEVDEIHDEKSNCFE